MQMKKITGLLAIIAALLALDLLAAGGEEYGIEVAGDIWKVIKPAGPSGEAGPARYVSPDGTSYDEPGFREAIKEKFSSGVVEPTLSETALLYPDETLRVIITLKDQPYGTVKAKVRGKYLWLINKAEAEANSARDEERLMKARLDLRSLNQRINAEAHRETKGTIQKEQEEVASEIATLGGHVVYRYTLINSLSALVPAGILEKISKMPGIAYISEDRLIRGDLDVSAKAIFADTWWNSGLSGSPFNIAILDSGMDAGHPAFAGKLITNGLFNATASTDSCLRDYDLSSTDDFNGHGTHVGGIVMSQGAADCPGCKGVAFGLNRTFNLKAAFNDSCESGSASMYFSDARAAVDWAESQAESPDVYNLSYGGYSGSDDDSFARFWDALISTNGKAVTFSAGNSGPGAYTIDTPAKAYNGLAVANMDDRGTTNREDDRIRDSSSRGPTPAGRKKPDVAGPGTSIYSTNAFWEVDYDFIAYSGTSMASPHAAGSLIFLQNIGPDILRQKSLLITTADSWSDNNTLNNRNDDGPVSGRHWDATYGWGYINLAEAFNHRENTAMDSLSPPNSYRLYKVSLDAGGKATVAWNRRVAYNGSASPVTWYTLSDIDIYLRRESDNSLLDSSMSAIDNVEQVAASGAEDGVLKVKLSGTIDGAASEPFGLAAAGPLIPAVLDDGFLNMAPPNVCPNLAFNLGEAVMNYGDVYSHDHTATLAAPVGWTLSTPNPQTAGSIAPNRRAGTVWSVTAPALGKGTFVVSGASFSYGENFSIAQQSFDISALSPSFSDAGCTHPFYGWIEEMKRRSITSGCSAGLFCPDAPVTRAQMAVFLIKAMNEAPSGAAFNAYFDDIAADFFAPYINRLYELGITTGCGARLYCPGTSLTRGQMSDVISRARGWSEFTPSSATFSDVPSSHLFFGHVERMWREGITSGCRTGLYCPEDPITRGEMAVFIIRAFFQR